MDEQELAIRCHRGDNAARRELYETYGARLLSLCRRYAVDKADAEDMMQDAFVKIFRVIGRFRWTRPENRNTTSITSMPGGAATGP